MEIIGGLSIGFLTNDWLGRVILPTIIGFYRCIELFFIKRKANLSIVQKSFLKKDGLNKDGIAEINQNMKHMVELPFREIGLTGWKLYAWQFIWSSVTAIVFLMIGGGIRVLLF
jgi:hypothetical protein